MITPAQRRLLDVLKLSVNDEGCEFWPLMNDWVRDRGPAQSLALRNINQTFDSLRRSGLIVLDEDGVVHLTEKGRSAR